MLVWQVHLYIVKLFLTPKNHMYNLIKLEEKMDVLHVNNLFII